MKYSNLNIILTPVYTVSLKIWYKCFPQTFCMDFWYVRVELINWKTRLQNDLLRVHSLHCRPIQWSVNPYPLTYLLIHIRCPEICKDTDTLIKNSELLLQGITSVLKTSYTTSNDKSLHVTLVRFVNHDNDKKDIHLAISGNLLYV